MNLKEILDDATERQRVETVAQVIAEADAENLEEIEDLIKARWLEIEAEKAATRVLGLALRDFRGTMDECLKDQNLSVPERRAFEEDLKVTELLLEGLG